MYKEPLAIQEAKQLHGIRTEQLALIPADDNQGEH